MVRQRWKEKISTEVGRQTSQVVLVVKNLPTNAGDRREMGLPWIGKITWRRAWQATAVSLPGESQGQRRLAGYSPWGHRESYITETEHTCPSRKT